MLIVFFVQDLGR